MLAVKEGLISNTIRNRLKDGAELTPDDAAKIIGCYKALTKSDMAADLQFDPHPMRRALAFCKCIAKSKIVKDKFASVVDEYTGNEMIEDTRHLATKAVLADAILHDLTLWKMIHPTDCG